jgi:hypothetical protein
MVLASTRRALSPSRIMVEKAEWLKLPLHVKTSAAA